MQAFENRLIKRRRHLAKWARREKVAAYRVYDRDIPEFPFAVDDYHGSVVIQVFETKRIPGEGDELELLIQQARTVIARVFEIPDERIFVKLRRRQKGISQYEKLDERHVEGLVIEDDLRFQINFSDYLDTGLFLDHRLTRRMVREQAMGKSVLNLFAYTGSFSVAASVGRATRVTTLDLSNTYLRWAQRNLEQNDCDSEIQEIVRDDASGFLRSAARRGDEWDLIILDPPSFSNSKRMSGAFDVQRDHVALIDMALKVTAEGGVILFSTNRRGFQLDQESLTQCAVEDITRQTTPLDFERRPPHKAFMIRKTVEG